MKNNGARVSAQAAGYLEFEGAIKDADCQVVDVPGGVSSDLGCCNLFGKTKIKEFRCGTCEYVTDQGAQGGEPKSLNRENSRGMSLREILDSELPAEGGKE